jgi:6-phosphogluconolactonase
MTETLVLDDPAEECARRLAEAASAGAHIALTGGSTPKLAYELLSEMDVDWSGATLWFGGERCVPPDDELSNYGMANAALLDRIAGADEGGPAVRRMRGEEGPSAGADDYERELRETLGEAMPRLDLVLLGLGPDAHVASLFPGKPALDVGDRSVVGVPEAGLEPYVPRISLTLPAINAARQVVFLVSGEGKAEAVERACGDSSRDAPGSLVRPHSGDLVLLLDRAAASRL